MILFVVCAPIQSIKGPQLSLIHSKERRSELHDYVMKSVLSYRVQIYAGTENWKCQQCAGEFISYV
jgi:hypothetical protein